MPDFHTFVSYFLVFLMSAIPRVWPTALKLGCISNFNMRFLLMGLISLVDEIQFMLISSHHICILKVYTFELLRWVQHLHAESLCVSLIICSQCAYLSLCSHLFLKASLYMYIHTCNFLLTRVFTWVRSLNQ